jgi:hypothetical protein
MEYDHVAVQVFLKTWSHLRYQSINVWNGLPCSKMTGRLEVFETGEKLGVYHFTFESNKTRKRYENPENNV